MTVPRYGCASAVMGQNRIFVLGVHNADHSNDSVEYWDVPVTSCDNNNPETLSTVMSSLSTWTILSRLTLSVQRPSCAVVDVGSSLLVAGGDEPTVEILDTYRHRVWNLPVKKAGTLGCNMVAVDNQIALIGGEKHSWCATFGITDKNSWCFRRLCEHEPTSGIIIGKDR